MVRHTPPRPVAVEELFPELVPLRTESVRLHPRRGTPTCRQSSVAMSKIRIFAIRNELENDTGWIYQYHLSDAPGIKLGGYPGWTQDPCWPDCPSCGRRMDHLLTVASWEADGESWRTWLPVEDRDTTDGRPGPMQGSHVIESAGLMLGDAGGVYVFECRSCPDRPVGYWFDGS